ncbi:MAG: Rep protein [Streptococcaceae bacterium]|jgi:hypothetical protein|nr:Rep protein [Streptococcaceae bacterium]
MRLWYNQKIIETSTYLEIWEYEQPIFSSKKSDDETQNENQNELFIQKKEKRKSFEEQTADKQYEHLKRKQKHYEQQRFHIARLIDQNFDTQTKFLTLTFKENLQDISTTNNHFKKFILRLNYQIFQSKKNQLKYLATWEKQKRGAIHYHLVLFSFPYIQGKRLTEIWGHGFIKINKIDVDSIANRGRYLSKYFAKDLEMKEHKKKAFFKSRNLQLPKETKSRSQTPYDTTGKEILYQKTYTRKTLDFSMNHEDEQDLPFVESEVKYTKIKKSLLES